MGLIDGLLGNASEVDAQKAGAEYARLLGAGEQIEKAYVLIRDMFLFTNKRLILVNKQGITGSKIEYHSIPYKTISHFAIETAGTFDMDAELKIFISGNPVPIQKQFNKKLDIYQLQALLATYVMK